MEERSTDLPRQLQRLREEVVGLRQNRRYLLERLAGLDEHLAQKERLVAALEREIDQDSSSGRPELRYGAVRTAIIERLAEEPGGMEASRLGNMLRDRFGSAVHPKSHFTTLSRLVAEGLVVKNGRLWTLVRERSDGDGGSVVGRSSL